MEQMTDAEVNAQMERFENFIKSTNLKKIGDRMMHIKDNNDGRYNKYMYIHRVLGIAANVKASMYHPTLRPWKFYGDILEYAALTSYIESVEVQLKKNLDNLKKN
jgi:hypothetical protein